MSNPRRQNLPDPYHLVGTVISGKYRLDAVLGIGGMGVVYLAHHTGINRKLALKVLKPDVAASDATIAEAFHREAKISGGLTHPNIISVTDADTLPDGTPFMAMELLECPTLEDELQRSKRFPLNRIDSLLGQICDALHYAHQSGLVHRDLKPANIALIGAGQVTEQVKILDFGIAKSLDEGVGKVSQAIGTPLYASPEQFVHGGDIDARADLYSLAVILYRMLAGVLPFQGKTIGEIVSLHLTAPPPPLRTHAPELAESIEAFVLGALAKQPSGRPATALDFLAGFRAACRGTVVGESSLPLLGSGTDLIASVLESASGTLPPANPATASPLPPELTGNITAAQVSLKRPTELPATLPPPGSPSGEVGRPPLGQRSQPETASQVFNRQPGDVPATASSPRLGIPVWAGALLVLVAVAMIGGGVYWAAFRAAATPDAANGAHTASDRRDDTSQTGGKPVVSSAYRERFDQTTSQVRQAMREIVPDSGGDPLLRDLRNAVQLNPVTIESRRRAVEVAENQVAQMTTTWSALTAPEPCATEHRVLADRYRQLRDALHNYGVSVRNLGNAFARTDFDMSQPRERFAESEREDLARDQMLLEQAWRDTRQAEAALRDRLNP